MRSEFFMVILLMIGCALGGYMLADKKGQIALANWERAATEKRDEERERNKVLFEETVNGLLADRAALWERLRAGWKPAIPATPGSLPSGRAADCTQGTAGAAGDAVPATSGTASLCEAERAKLIDDGQKVMLRCQRIQDWAVGVSAP